MDVDWQKVLREAQQKELALQKEAQAIHDEKELAQKIKHGLKVASALHFLGIDPSAMSQDLEFVHVGDFFFGGDFDQDKGMVYINLQVSVELTPEQQEYISDRSNYWQYTRSINPGWIDPNNAAVLQKERAGIASDMDDLIANRERLVEEMAKQKPEAQQPAPQGDPYVLNFLRESIRQIEAGTPDDSANLIYALARWITGYQGS